MLNTRAEIITVRFYSKDGSHEMPDARFVSWDRAHRAIDWWAERGNGIGIVIAAQEVSAVSKDETPIPATPTIPDADEIAEHRYSEYEDDQAQYEDDEQEHEDDMSADEMRAAPNWWL